MNEREYRLLKKISQLEMEKDSLLRRLQKAEDLNFAAFRRNQEMSEYIRQLERLNGAEGIYHVAP